MATFVLVPGAWLGGWAWQRVTPLLRGAGHDVYPQTLTGLGERAHLARPEIGLETHIQDVVNVCEYEELCEVVLVGHSYGGRVISGVADRVPERIAQLVYLDAIVPSDGQALFDFWASPAGRAAVEAEARAAGDGWRWPFPQDRQALDRPGGQARGLSEADERWLRAKAVPQPLQTFAQPVRLANPAAAALPRTFIRTAAPLEYVGWLQTAPGWRFREIDTGHYPMVSTPRELAGLRLELA